MIHRLGCQTERCSKSSPKSRGFFPTSFVMRGLWYSRRHQKCVEGVSCSEDNLPNGAGGKFVLNSLCPGKDVRQESHFNVFNRRQSEGFVEISATSVFSVQRLGFENIECKSRDTQRDSTINVSRILCDMKVPFRCNLIEGVLRIPSSAPLNLTHWGSLWVARSVDFPFSFLNYSSESSTSTCSPFRSSFTGKVFV